MSLIGRYYKQSNSKVTCAFVEAIAVQAQKLYCCLKNILIEMLNNNRKYIADKNDEKIMKEVLAESLPQVNQEMKKLFLDKYFYPYGKGIIVKLFRT